jgi:hypothetical protein
MRRLGRLFSTRWPSVSSVPPNNDLKLGMVRIGVSPLISVLGGADSVMRTLVRTRSLSAGVQGIAASYPIGYPIGGTLT